MIHSKGAREVSLTQLEIAPNAFAHLQALYMRTVPQSTCASLALELEPLAIISAPVRVVALNTINVFCLCLRLDPGKRWRVSCRLVSRPPRLVAESHLTAPLEVLAMTWL